MLHFVCISLVIAGEPSENTYFVFSLPRSWEDHECEVKVTARSEARVTLTGKVRSEVISISAGSFGTFSLGSQERVTYGVEEKAFEITSDNPVTVIIGSKVHTNERTEDEILGRSPGQNDTMYYIVSRIGNSASAYYPLSFFSVAATEDDTDLDIYNPIMDVTTQIKLDKFETYTEDAAQFESKFTDLTGFRISASKPITVISGNGRIDVGDTWWHYICDSLPSTADLDKYYTSFPIGFGEEDTGYVLRILATSDDTDVFSNGMLQVTLHEGDHHDLTIISSASVVMVSLWYISPAYVFFHLFKDDISTID